MPDHDNDPAPIAAAPRIASIGARRVPVVLVLGGRPLANAGLRALVASTGSLDAVTTEQLGGQLGAGNAGKPDCVLLAIDDVDDEAVPERIQMARAAWKPAHVLVIAADCVRERAVELVRAGARGVVDMDDDAPELAKAIRKVCEGELWLDRASLSALIDQLAVNTRGHNPILARASQLTQREREVIDLVAQGLSNKAIGRQLDISDNTVRHHLTAIFAKLGVADRLALAVHATRAA